MLAAPYLLLFEKFNGPLMLQCKMFFRLRDFLVLLAVHVLTVASSHADNQTCSAEASQFDGLCFYVGAGVGLSSLSGFDDSDSAWKIDNIGSTSLELYLGYHFMPRWFAELSYADYGAMDLTNPYGATYEYAEISFSGFSVKGGYYLPVSWVTFGKIESSSFQPFVKMGMANVTSSVSDSRVRFNEDGIKPQVGLGVDWNFAEDWQLRGQWEVTSGLATVTQVAVNYSFSFDADVSSRPSHQAAPINQNDYQPLSAVNGKAKKQKGKVTYDMFSFEPSSLTIILGSNALLNKIKRILLEYPHLHISILDAELSHNTEAEYKLLSQQRGGRLREILIDHGISAERIDRDYYAQSVDNHYQSTDFFGREINVKTLVLAPISEDSWALFNR